EFFVADLERLASVAAEDYAVAFLNLHGAALAVIQQPAIAHADDLAAGRLILGGVGQHDAAGGACFRLFPLDDQAVADWLEPNVARLDLLLLLAFGRSRHK